MCKVLFLWKNIYDEEKIHQEHNISYLNLKDDGSLAWPKLNAMTLFGLVFTALYSMLSNEEIMNDFDESTTSSLEGLKSARSTMHAKMIFFLIQSSYYLSTMQLQSLKQFALTFFKIIYQNLI